MCKNGRIFVSPQKEIDRMSRLSRYFRFLVNFTLIPVKVNYEKCFITFGLSSWRFGIYNLIMIFGVVTQWMALGLTFGFSNSMKAFLQTFQNSNATDNISQFGFMLMFFCYQTCIIIFYKNLGR